MSQIIFDTDFLIKVTNDPIPKLDLREISEEYSLCTLSTTVREIEGLTKHYEKKTSRRARRALEVLKMLEHEGHAIKFSIIEMSDNHVENDIMLIEYAKELHENSNDEALIATLDHSLLSRMERIGIGYLTLQKNSPIFRKSREQRI